MNGNRASRSDHPPATMMLLHESINLQVKIIQVFPPFITAVHLQLKKYVTHSFKKKMVHKWFWLSVKMFN